MPNFDTPMVVRSNNSLNSGKLFSHINLGAKWDTLGRFTPRWAQSRIIIFSDFAYI